MIQTIDPKDYVPQNNASERIDIEDVMVNWFST